MDPVPRPHLEKCLDVGVRCQRDDGVLLAVAHDGAQAEAVHLDGQRGGPGGRLGRGEEGSNGIRAAMRKRG